MKFTTERIIPNLSECRVPLRAHMARYRFAEPFVRDSLALDVGCGCGYGSHHLATAATERVVGIDISPEAVAYARQHYHAINLDFEVADATALPFPDEAFENVVCLEVFEHVRDQQRLLAEARRVLKPGGRFVVSTPNARLFSPGGEPLNPWHIREFTQEEFVAMLSSHFQDVQLWGQTARAALALPFARFHLRMQRMVIARHSPLSRVVGTVYDLVRKALMMPTRLAVERMKRDPVVIARADELPRHQIWYFLAVGANA